MGNEGDKDVMRFLALQNSTPTLIRWASGIAILLSTRTLDMSVKCISSNRNVEPHTYLERLPSKRQNCTKLLTYHSLKPPESNFPCKAKNTEVAGHSFACIRSFLKALHTRIISSLRSPVSCRRAASGQHWERLWNNSFSC